MDYIPIPTYVVLDTETGGFDPRVNPLTQVAMIVVDQHLEEIAGMMQRIIPEPGKSVHPEAAKINGYDAQLWLETGMHQAAADDFVTAFLFQHFKTRQGIAVAHNVSFDQRFFEYYLPQAKAWLHPHWHCTMRQLQVWRKTKGQPGSAKLANLAEVSGFVHSGADKAHDALSDTKACLAGLRWMMKHSGMVNWKPVEYSEEIQKLYASQSIP